MENQLNQLGSLLMELKYKYTELKEGSSNHKIMQNHYLNQIEVIEKRIKDCGKRVSIVRVWCINQYSSERPQITLYYSDVDEQTALAIAQRDHPGFAYQASVIVPGKPHKAL